MYFRCRMSKMDSSHRGLVRPRMQKGVPHAHPTAPRSTSPTNGFRLPPARRQSGCPDGRSSIMCGETELMFSQARSVVGKRAWGPRDRNREDQRSDDPGLASGRRNRTGGLRRDPGGRRDRRDPPYEREPSLQRLLRRRRREFSCTPVRSSELIDTCRRPSWQAPCSGGTEALKDGRGLVKRRVDVAYNGAAGAPDVNGAVGSFQQRMGGAGSCAARLS